MALFPVILVNHEAVKGNQVVINHEKIHLVQQAELLVLPFYVLYFINYVINLVRYRKHHLAYLNISFEREAYAREADLTYLSKRNWYSWCRYL